jgi:hypothetical protein
VLSLLCFVELKVLDPAPTMTADIVTRLLNGLGRWRVALERQGTAKNRQGEVALLKQAQNAPEANAAAVFEHGFGSEIAPREVLCLTRRLCQARFRLAVAIGE